MFPTDSQSHPSAGILIEAAEGISAFNVALVILLLYKTELYCHIQLFFIQYKYNKADCDKWGWNNNGNVSQ